MGLGVYTFVLAPHPNEMRNQELMALVLILICAPAFAVAAIAALVSACSRMKQKRALVVACLLIAVQAVLWTCVIAAEVNRPHVGSGRAGGF